MNMRLEIGRSSSDIEEEGLDTKLIRVYLDGDYITTLSITHDTITDRLSLNYVDSKRQSCEAELHYKEVES